MSPPNLQKYFEKCSPTFSEHFFLIHHYSMNSCSMWTISSLTSRRWAYPISLPSHGHPAILSPIAPPSPIAATPVHCNLYAVHLDCATATAHPLRCHRRCRLPSQRSPTLIAADSVAVHRWWSRQWRACQQREINKVKNMIGAAGANGFAQGDRRSDYW